jgi:uncharacterized protein (TIGR02271 family)
MISTDQIQNLLSSGGGTVVGEGGEKIGKVGQFYLDDQTNQPEWVTVKTGMFGGAETFIPLTDGSVEGDQIRVPYSKDKVKDAPRVDADGSLSQDQEAELYRYYGKSYSEATSDSGLPAGGAPAQGRGQRDDRAGEAGVVGRDTSGPTTDDAMTRSEEQLHVGTEKGESGKARLRKFVVTENVTQTVPVSHEEVRLEREPITEANRGDAMAGGDITEEEHEVTLHEERPVVDKETVPVERVRMDTETVTENQQVNEEVRKEQIETDTSQTDKSTRGNKR